MMHFDWDEAKAAANERKHGISFEEAIEVFIDPYAISIPDRVTDGEQSWQTIGMVRGVLLLLVAHTLMTDNDQDECVRLISTRKAIRRERRRYEERHEN